MTLPDHKTKLVCTIGPASQAPTILEEMIQAGMNVARLNFSHGDFANHKNIIENIRTAADKLGKRVAIMADLPGPKMRIGQLVNEPLELQTGATFTLTTNAIVGNEERASVSFQRLPKVVKAKDNLFLNDGFIQLEVIKQDLRKGTKLSYGRIAKPQYIVVCVRETYVLRKSYSSDAVQLSRLVFTRPRNCTVSAADGSCRLARWR